MKRKEAMFAAARNASTPILPPLSGTVLPSIAILKELVRTRNSLTFNEGKVGLCFFGVYHDTSNPNPLFYVKAFFMKDMKRCFPQQFFEVYSHGFEAEITCKS